MQQLWGLTGPQFLIVYSAAFAASILLAIVPKYAYVFGARGKLTHYQLAFLLGGTGRVLLLGCAELLESGRVDRLPGGRLRMERDFTARDPLQRAIVKVMSVSAPWQERVAKLRRDPVIDELKAELRASGLMLSRGSMELLRVAALLPIAIWFAGLARAINEAIVHQPSGDLITLLLISFFVIPLVLTLVLRRGALVTAKGAALAGRVRRNHAEEERAGNDPGTIDFRLTGLAVIGLGAADIGLRRLVGKARKNDAGLNTSGESWLTRDPNG
ncbi:MAG TPA: TIGR04222 domain-containing membrane protein [Pseudonocardiaceae bacterium]|jgi:uncharacterized protein (TIGR04222 family)